MGILNAAGPTDSPVSLNNVFLSIPILLIGFHSISSKDQPHEAIAERNNGREWAATANTQWYACVIEWNKFDLL